jgi:hypothetical protein
MNGILETMAFVLVIAGQFLAAIVLIAKRKTIFADSEARLSREGRGSEDPAEASSESPAHDGQEHQPRPA